MLKKVDLYILYLINHLVATFVDKIVFCRNELTLLVHPDYLSLVLRFLKMCSALNFYILTDLICVDYPFNSKRFELSYILISVLYNIRLRIKCFVGEPYFCGSVSSIFKSAGWLEREVYDLFGVFFFEHFDLRRILTDYGFEGYPLRKDFPLSGFVEIRYNEGLKRIVFEPIEFVQKFRYFDFKNPWSV